MTPVLLHRGAAGQPWAETRNGKAPSVAGGAQKIPVRGIQRTRNLWFTRSRWTPRISEVHTIVAVRLKPRMTILLNETYGPWQGYVLQRNNPLFETARPSWQANRGQPSV